MRYILAVSGFVAAVAAHGIVDNIVIDGTFYPSYDARVDHEFNVKRINWEHPKGGAGSVGPVADVASPEIACRYNPLVAPSIHAVARAGSKMTFQWTAWFGNHKGPVLTYMGLLSPEKTQMKDVGFFKIDEGAYDPATKTWGTDELVKNNNSRTVTIPSDIKPGMYVVRHEIIGLHFAWRENAAKKTSGAQMYPICLNVQVTGSGTATPPTVHFPGAYNWRDPGILINTKYGPNIYYSPGPAVYKGERNPPEGPVPVVRETGALTGEQGRRYAQRRAQANAGLMSAVQADIKAKKTGEGGCQWDPAIGPSSMKCSPVNPGNPNYAGYAQPVGSPLYTDHPGSAMKGKPPPKSFGNEPKFLL